LKGSWKF